MVNNGGLGCVGGVHRRIGDLAQRRLRPESARPRRVRWEVGSANYEDLRAPELGAEALRAVVVDQGHCL